MPRLQPIQPENATGDAKQLLDAVQDKLGFVPNLAKVLANSPAALKSYLQFGEALEQGFLGAKLRQQIAIAVSQANGCDYCVAAHSAIGKSEGLCDNELNDARTGVSPDSKVETVLHFARQLVENRGWVSDDELARVRKAGFGDGEIAEIVATVAWKTFSNYFNHVAETEVDFPAVAGAGV